MDARGEGGEGSGRGGAGRGDIWKKGVFVKFRHFGEQ